MVEENPEAVHHVAGDQFQGPGRRKGRPAAEKQQGEPPQGKPGGERHAQKDEEECQGVAHIPGDDHVIPHQQQGVARHHHSGGEGLQIPLLLPQPLQLLGQQQGEGDLHDLRRSDLKGDAGDLQPGLVAGGGAAHAQGRQQQSDEDEVEGHHPLPPLQHDLHVDHGHEHIGAQPQQQGRPLDAHIPDHAAHAVGIHIVGGAGDQHHAVQCGGAAESQQHQIGLLDEVRQDGFQSIPHGCFVPPGAKFDRCSIPQRKRGVNAGNLFLHFVQNMIY